MSLINDALKRAKESQRKDNPPVGSSLHPMETNPKERDSNLVLPVVIIFLIVAALGLIGLAMVKHNSTKIPAENLATAPAIVPKPPVVTAVPLEINLPPPATPPTNSPATSTPVVVAAPVAPPVAATNSVVTSSPTPKPLRLQGISYDAAHPSAIVNGKAVYVGSRVDGMRVTAISPDSVTLAGGGRTKTLVVDEP
jgi:hypothetical protein